MTLHYPVVVEREDNGTFSAWVAGLPGIYAAADPAAVAKRAIRSTLAAHIEAPAQWPQGRTAAQGLCRRLVRTKATAYETAGARESNAV